RDAVGGGKFSGIAVGRALLGGERLPQAMHRALADLADELLDLLRLDAPASEPPRAVDVGVRHRPAGIRFERERGRQPARAEIAGKRVVVAAGGAGEAVEQAVHAFEYGARPEETGTGEPRRAQSGLRRPARMQALGPGALREIFDDAAGHGTDDAERIDKMARIELERGADGGRRRHGAEHGGGVKARLWHPLGRPDAEPAE